jgi:hypothetical protein
MADMPIGTSSTPSPAPDGAATGALDREAQAAYALAQERQTGGLTRRHR